MFDRQSLILLLTLGLFFQVTKSYSQVTIWSEDFESYANNTQSVTGVWFFSCSDCTGPRGVQDGEIVATGDDSFGSPDDANGSWTALPIDISGHTNVSFSVDLSESGVWESPNFVARTIDIDVLQ